MGVIGALGGDAVGMAYSAAGHPGLPHLGDVPPEWEHTPLFILDGGIAGGGAERAVSAGPRGWRKQLSGCPWSQ